MHTKKSSASSSVSSRSSSASSRTSRRSSAKSSRSASSVARPRGVSRTAEMHVWSEIATARNEALDLFLNSPRAHRGYWLSVADALEDVQTRLAKGGRA